MYFMQKARFMVLSATSIRNYSTLGFSNTFQLSQYFGFPGISMVKTVPKKTGISKSESFTEVVPK